MSREDLLARAREFRRSPTRSEALFWAAIRNRALGFKFRRQVVLGPFIADFLCSERQLIVEIDGGIHDEQRERDAERQAWLEASGYRVHRVTASDVELRLQAVLAELRTVLERHSPTRTGVQPS